MRWLRHSVLILPIDAHESSARGRVCRDKATILEREHAEQETGELVAAGVAPVQVGCMVQLLV